MKLIVGLWNPWKEYEFTRHNVGFIVLDWIKDCYNFTSFLQNKKFNALISSWKIGKWTILLAKPQTFMNLSWNSVVKIINFYKIKFKDILVVHDDIDLPFWKIKLKYNGSHGWHNWVKDIINKIWTDKFWRLKIWIGRPASKDMVVDYVLSKFRQEELKLIEEKRIEIIKKVEEWLKNVW